MAELTYDAVKAAAKLSGVRLIHWSEAQLDEHIMLREAWGVYSVHSMEYLSKHVTPTRLLEAVTRAAEAVKWPSQK